MIKEQEKWKKNHTYIWTYSFSPSDYWLFHFLKADSHFAVHLTTAFERKLFLRVLLTCGYSRYAFRLLSVFRTVSHVRMRYACRNSLTNEKYTYGNVPYPCRQVWTKISFSHEVLTAEAGLLCPLNFSLSLDLSRNTSAARLVHGRQVIHYQVKRCHKCSSFVLLWSCSFIYLVLGF